MSHVHASTNIYIQLTKIFAMSRRIFLKLHLMNHRSFLYILAKLHAKIVKSKQDTAKYLAYYNVAGAC